jgi:hypothetical protein
MSSEREKRRCWGLARTRQVLVPTWRGGLALAALALLFSLLVVPRLHAFLAVTNPRTGGYLVVEGWGTDSMLEETVREFRRSSYKQVLVTGGPVDTGAPLAEYKTYAQRGTEILLRIGLKTNEVMAVPAPRVRQDRTYTSARALRRWLDLYDAGANRINLMTEGPHARRSRLLFEMALGKSIEVGVVALPPIDYDEAHWWRSSAGVRGVVGELLAYFYARVLFQP